MAAHCFNNIIAHILHGVYGAMCVMMLETPVRALNDGHVCALNVGHASIMLTLKASILLFINGNGVAEAAVHVM